MTLPAASNEIAAVVERVDAGRRGRILAIDDELMMLKSIRRMLEQHDVVCVDNATEALAMLDRGDRFDLILSDVTMPHMNGMEFYEHVLAKHPTLAPTIVFLTGGTVSVHTTDFLAVIRNVCLHKPILPKDLRAFVAQRLASIRR